MVARLFALDGLMGLNLRSTHRYGPRSCRLEVSFFFGFFLCDFSFEKQKRTVHKCLASLTEKKWLPVRHTGGLGKAEVRTVRRM